MKQMKSLIVLTAVALAATACSDHESLPDNTPNGNAILFGTTVEVETKAAVTGKNIPNGDKVGIYALKDAISPTWAASDNLMDNVPATSDGAGTLSYSPLKEYAENNLHNFYAYYPYTAASLDEDGIKVPQAGVAPKLQVTLKKTPAEQLDYMYAEPILNYKRDKEAVASIVPQKLVFKHALTQIRFKFKNGEESNKVSLVKIEVKDQDKGTMDITNGSWSGLTATGSEGNTFTFYQWAAPEEVAGKAEVDISGQLMLFPKADMTNNTDLTIVLSMKDNTGADKTSTIIPKVPASGLAAGKSYLYTLIYNEAGKDHISLSAEVVDWVEATGGDLPAIPNPSN